MNKTPWTVADTYSHEGPQCPHCGRQYTADEPYFYDEMNYTEDNCDACEKPFTVSVNTSTYWACEPIEDCEPDGVSAPNPHPAVEGETR